MDTLIKDYDTQLIEAGCAPGSGRWGALANLSDDISPVFPYLNARLDSVWYDHENAVLIWREPDQAYALHPHEIRLARVENPLQAKQFIAEIVDRINQTWQERREITPRFTEKRLPAVMDIFKLLPKTNCKACGYLTCLAYAADLRIAAAQPEQCPPLSQVDNAEKRARILQLTTLD